MPIGIATGALKPFSQWPATAGRVRPCFPSFHNPRSQISLRRAARRDSLVCGFAGTARIRGATRLGVLPQGEKSLVTSRSASPSAAPVLTEHAMLTEERNAVAGERGRAPEGAWLGLALSGGGIRSATFCLGALQRLAKADILKHFDLQSSVSGGGYTAASVQWWWTRSRRYDAGAEFPYGTQLAASIATESGPLAFLRWHASYLAPGGGISIWSAIAVVLRTLLVSLFVWLPLAVGAMYVLEAVPNHLAHRLSLDAISQWHVRIAPLDVAMPLFATIALAGALAVLALFLAATAFLVVLSIVIPPETVDNRSERIHRAAWCAALGAGVGACGLIVYGTIAGMYDPSNIDPVSRAVAMIAQGLATLGSVLIVIAAIALVVAVLQFFNRLEFGVNYGFRRWLDLSATYAFAASLPLLVLASLPVAAAALSQFPSQHSGKGAALLGLFTAASGVVSGLYGHFVQAQRVAPKYAARWAATLAGAAFLYLILLSAHLTAHFLLAETDARLTQQRAEEALFAILFFSVLFGWMSNLNYLGLHRFYRDRLMEAFLPSNSRQAAEAPKYSDADRVPIADVWDPAKAPGAGRPYPLFNTNAILINDRDATVALRGGDSFVLSPLFLGSSATEWARTREHGERYSPLTLASAMAASGAAANANAAYIGSGVTRDRLISIVMMLLNVRLGLWLAAPGAKASNPNYFSPGFRYGVLRTGYRRDSTFMELTDGGHFENLGVYELVRRRCDLVVALDSEEDPSTAMSALASVCQRVLEDFNVTIAVGDKADTIAPGGDMGYPSGAKFTAQSFFVCSMEYGPRRVPGCGGCVGEEAGGPRCSAHAPKAGCFVYIKSNMIKGLSFPARGYKAKNPDFPNQSTMDQFFEPAQFEAYRELGYSSVDDFVAALGLDKVDPTSLFAAVATAAAERDSSGGDEAVWS
jgi:hypothetical protein